MEKTALIGISLSKEYQNHLTSSLEETKRLAETAGGQVELTIIQKRLKRDPATLVGQGKAEEIALIAKNQSFDTVIFNEDLTPAQQKNLQEIIPAKVIDRTRLILDIFAQRARTKEGILQVELAQLNYLLPRITEKFGRFEQQTGGIGTRGPGERKLEVDQRHIRNRIVHIKKEMEHVKIHRALQRQNRERVPLPLVALIGYTNVGKSTLLNAITPDKEPGVYADDKLFATLDPTTRRVKLPGGRIALFSDTVGFIQQLPHHLVAAFHSTLEEVSNANLLAIILDGSKPDWEEDYIVVQQVLKDLKANHLPQLMAFNKSDRLTPAQRAMLKRENRLILSAKTEEGLASFLEKIESRLDVPLLEKEFILPYHHQNLLSVLYETARIVSKKPVSTGTHFKVRIDEQNWGFIQKELNRKKA